MSGRTGNYIKVIDENEVKNESRRYFVYSGVALGGMMAGIILPSWVLTGATLGGIGAGCLTYAMSLRAELNSARLNSQLNLEKTK